MTYTDARALFDAMPLAQQDAVTRIFMRIYGAFPNVREAFVQAVADEELEMMLLATQPAEGLMQ